MRYNKVKEFIGKRVEIRFFDDTIVSGTLEEQSGGWFRVKEECLNFRASSVVELRALKGVKQCGES